MKKRVICGAVLSVFVFAGCGSKTDANERNFGSAISQYLAKKGDLCIGLKKWPVDVTEGQMRIQKLMSDGQAKPTPLDALVTAGLVSVADAQVDEISEAMGSTYHKPTGKKITVKRYSLTDMGKKFYSEKEVEEFGLSGSKKIMQGDICYGKKSLDKVVKWEGPMKFGDYQEANVKYLYKIDGLADWAKNPAIQTAFPYIAQVIDAAGKKEQQGGVKLTSQGWEPKGLD